MNGRLTGLIWSPVYVNSSQRRAEVNSLWRGSVTWNCGEVVSSRVLQEIHETTSLKSNIFSQHFHNFSGKHCILSRKLTLWLYRCISTDTKNLSPHSAPWHKCVWHPYKYNIPVYNIYIYDYIYDYIYTHTHIYIYIYTHTYIYVYPCGTQYRQCLRFTKHISFSLSIWSIEIPHRHVSQAWGPWGPFGQGWGWSNRANWMPKMAVFWQWFNGNSRILKWRYCTIFLAIFWGYIPLHRPEK